MAISIFASNFTKLSTICIIAWKQESPDHLKYGESSLMETMASSEELRRQRSNSSTAGLKPSSTWDIFGAGCDRLERMSCRTIFREYPVRLFSCIKRLFASLASLPSKASLASNHHNFVDFKRHSHVNLVSLLCRIVSVSSKMLNVRSR